MSDGKAWPTQRRVRLAVAQIGGAVQRCVERHAIGRHGALQRIREIMANNKLSAAEAMDAPTHAAAGYLTSGREHLWYRDNALVLLVDAGADPDRAARLARLREQSQRVRSGDAVFEPPVTLTPTANPQPATMDIEML
jgi:hypothetical protein